MRKTKAEFYHREIGECAKLSDLKLVANKLSYWKE